MKWPLRANQRHKYSGQMNIHNKEARDGMDARIGNGCKTAAHVSFRAVPKMELKSKYNVANKRPNVYKKRPPRGIISLVTCGRVSDGLWVG